MEILEEANIFDTNTTLLYKWAVSYKVPTIYIIVRKVGGSLIYVNTFQEITRDISRGIGLREIYDKYRKQNNRIVLDLIIYLYFLYSSTQDQNESQREEIQRKVVDLDKSNRVGSTRFDSYERLEMLIRGFQTRIQMYMNEDLQRLAFIENIQSILLGVNPESIFSSNFDITGSILNISPTKNNKMLELNDAINLFNDSQATIFTPYIQYNDSYGRSYYRILKGNLKYESLSILSNVGGNRDPDTFYITLWLGNNTTMSVSNKIGINDIFDPAILEKANTTSFYRVTYRLSDGILVTTLPNTPKGNQVTDMNELFARLELGLPGLNVRYVNSVRNKGSFDIYDLDIDETSILHLILNSTFSPFLYTEERLRPFAYKHRLDIHYREIFSRVGEQVKVINEESGATFPLSVSSISLTIQFLSSTGSVPLKYVQDGKNVDFLSPENFKWTRFTVNGGVTQNDINKCILHLKAFFCYYKQYKQSILDSIYSNFPKEILSALNDRFYLKFENEKSKDSKSLRRIEELKAQIPELFVDSYADSCQLNAQPVIIPKEGRKAWESETFYYKGEQRNRQTLDYPPNKPKWIFGCNTRERPFIGVRPSENLSNSKEFPYVPCCYKKDQMDPNLNSDYNVYYNGYVKPEQLKKPGHVHKTSRFMKPGEIARVPQILNRGLSAYRNLDELRTLLKVTDFSRPWEFVRFGVPNDPNSLLHCVLEAISDPNYDGSRAYVQNIRRMIAVETHPDLLKQEMYDYETDTIRNLLSDTNRYFDPDLFYRSIEEFFQINLFVYNTYKDEFSADLSEVVLPRHRNFHVRPERTFRPTILILSHYGSDPDSDYPKCELLVDFNPESNLVIKMFDSQMTKNTYKFLISYANNITWLPHVRNCVNIQSPPPVLYPHDNIYGKFDYVDILQGNGQLVAQYIDSIGKARSYTFQYPDGYISFVTLPGMPENVPSYKDLARPPVQVIRNNLGTNIATAKSVDNLGRCDGIWFQMFEITEGIYVPIEPTLSLPPEYQDLPVGSNNPIQTISTQNNTIRYMKLTRTLHLIYDFIEWLFEVDRKNKLSQNQEPKAENLRWIFDNDNYFGDSSTYYDFTHVPRDLPQISTVEEGLQYLSSKIPQFRGRITAYNLDFRNKLYKYLSEYEERTVGEIPLIRGYLDNYFMSASDFKSSKNNMILIGMDIFDKWQSDRFASAEKIYQIREKIDMGIASILYPILYIDENQKIWLIQNTFDGNLYSAFAIGINWITRGINSGRSTEPIEEKNTPAHFLFKIGVSQQIIPTIDNTNGFDIYVNILQYSENRFGALLPLL